LQDAVPPAPYETVERVLSSELDPVQRGRIAHVERVPIAAASVAQVHEGRLDTGERVAIKVQRPEAHDQIERDLAILSMGARVLDVVPSFHLLSLPGSIAQFGDALRAQLDFRLEAQNNRRLGANFKSMKGVRVPDLYDELCTERVLTMEMIDGHKATNPEKVTGKKERRKLAARGGEAILKMVFEDGFVHADLHPGNILFQDDGTMVFIDLGLVAEIPQDLMRPWIDTFTALGKNDGKAAARLFYSYAPTVGTKDYAAYERDTVAFFGRFEGKRLGEVEVSEVVGGMMNILRRHRIQVEPVFTVVNLGVLVAEGLGKQLDPDIDIVQMALPYLVEMAKRAPEGRPPLREPPS
jgi:ubiquinone biosynthesis protein